MNPPFDLSNILANVQTVGCAPRRPLLEHDSDHDFILRIDNSTLETFQTCQRAAEFYCVERREAPSTPALLFGSAIHEGLAVLYGGPRTTERITDAVQATLNHMRTYYSPSADEWRTPQLACETMIAYCETYANELIRPVIADDGKRFVERPFSLHVGTITIDATLPYPARKLTDAIDSDEPLYIRKLHIFWSGRLDLAVTENDDNVWVTDHKTTSIGGNDFFADFQLSQQMNGYVWALRRLLPKRNIVGTIINAIIQRKPTKTGKQLEFRRESVYQPLWMEKEWVSDMLTNVERFAHSLVTGKFPKSTKWCFGKYGRCKYHEVCTIQPELRMSFLHGINYQNVTWSPLSDR